METVPSLNMMYTEEKGYVTVEHAQARGLHVKKLNRTQFRQMLRSGDDMPDWFAFRSVLEVLRELCWDSAAVLKAYARAVNPSLRLSAGSLDEQRPQEPSIGGRSGRERASAQWLRPHLP